jgi:hypothetical protein
MTVQRAREAAWQWVIENAPEAPGFRGAFFHGSTNWLPDDASLPATSDVDVMVVLADPEPPVKPGKFIYGGVLLEVSYLSLDQLPSPDHVLGQSHLAGSFAAPSVILDPSGHLTRLQEAVSREYATRRWVRKRCEHARDKVLNNLQGLSESAPFHDQVMPWLFAAGVTAHVLLVAGLKNPTVRRRYVAARELLLEYGHAGFHDALLETLGCARMSRARVEQHVTALADVFDAAKAVVRAPFFFASDISEIARPIAIDGSLELIERGLHREALFWVVATYSRCLKVLDQDAPAAMRERFDPGYRTLLGDLGIASFADLGQRADQVRRFLPRVWDVAEAIMAVNPGIKD